MNRQSQQLVVASVVAFLTSGVITLAGLSAAQDMNMGGTPPPGDGMSMPPGEMQPMMDTGDPQQFQPMDGYRSMDQGTPPMFQDTQRHEFGDMKTDFQMDGPRFQREGDNFQKDGPRFQREGDNFQKDGPIFQRDGMNFQKDGDRFRQGAPDFGGKTGAERGFRGGFKEKEGMEHTGGRFERKPMDGFSEKEGVFGKGTSYPLKDEQGGKKGIFGKDTQWPVRGEHAGAEDGNGRGSPNFDMSQFDQFVPKKSNANVDSLLESLPTGEGESAPTLTAAQEKKVENTLGNADAAETKAVSGLQNIFKKKPTKSSATKATNHILTLVKQWVSVQKLADGLGDFESDVVDHASASATSFADTIVEACDAASEFFDGKWKGEKVCAVAQKQIHAAAGEEEFE